MNGTIVTGALLWLAVFSPCLLAQTGLPAGFTEIDCLCKPGDTMSKSALRSTGRSDNYLKLIAVHPKTLKVLRTKSREDYRKLPLGTKVYAPESMALTSASFTIWDMSILQICQHRLGDVPLDDCVGELVRINGINTCNISSLIRPVNGAVFIPNEFLLSPESRLDRGHIPKAVPEKFPGHAIKAAVRAFKDPLSGPPGPAGFPGAVKIPDAIPR